MEELSIYEAKNAGAVCQELDCCVIHFSRCPGCLSETLKERLLILNVPWLLDGREYAKTGVFVCCEELDERQLLRNMISMLREHKSKEIL